MSGAITFTCAWAFTSGGPNPAIGLNIAFPDTSALYWVTPFAIDQAATIIVNGEFPDARYMSWNAYDASLTTYDINGVKSGLPDFAIVPDAGSVNCAADYQLKPDADGYYTVVASAAKDRPANATDAKGVSWLANSPTLANTRHMLIVRNMLPNGFDQAVQNVPVDSTQQAAEAVMQAYYPRAWVCARSTFEAGGWQACAK